MRTNFEACLAQILKHEGGYVNHPKDPGGETNMGISKRSYPHEDIKNMTRSRAAVIYKRDYWDPVRGDDLPQGLDLVAFDAAVNSGVSRGSKWVQQAVGAKEDGRIGPETIRRANSVAPLTAINRACDARLAFLQSLGTWKTFGAGWSNRIADVRQKATIMSAKWSQPTVETIEARPPVQTNPLTSFFAWLGSLFGGKR